jgi:hypothetical protein
MPVSSMNVARTAATADSIIRVGEGRGFVVKDPEQTEGRLVITAAHCLPFFPPCASISSLEERTYQALLGPLGQEPAVWAECLFVDPIGDVAVLGPPDGQELWEQCEAYETIMQALVPFSIADAPKSSTAWLLSLENRWFRCVATHDHGPLWITDAAEGIVGGMSGSPILANDASAIGVVCTSGGSTEVMHKEGGPNPRLVYHLPTRILARPHPSKALGGN